MTDRPTVGTLGEPPERDPEEKADGVVLFDPTPRPRHEVIDLDWTAQPRSKLGPILVVLVLVGALGFLGYGVYSGDAEVAPPVSVAPPPGNEPPLAEPPPLETGLVAIGGSQLTAPARASVNLSVRALDDRGVPMPDTLIRFFVMAGRGELSAAESRTDENGLARTTLTLSDRAGRTEVVAGLTASALEARFVVQVPAGPAARVEIVSGHRQEAEVGQLLDESATVRVTDAAGNPVSGIQVRFEVTAGEGMVAPSRRQTDAEGLAWTTWRLGPLAGDQQLTVSAAGIPGRAEIEAVGIGRSEPTGYIPPRAGTGPVTVERTDFVIGGSHVCRLEGTVAVCRGANDRGQRGEGRIGGLAGLASGLSHVCGLDASGAAVCWGANDGGQLGDGSRDDRAEPEPIRTELHFSKLTAGQAHTCGIAAGGIPACWGQNLNGQLGDNSRTDSWSPRTVGNGVSFVDLVAGWNHTCGITPNGNAFCWGLNSEGQLGDGSRLDRLVPTLVLGSVETITAGSAHTCGTGPDGVVCWGDNRVGQLGDGTTVARTQAVQVRGLPGRPTQLVAGAAHTCALLPGGEAYCWGQNLYGQLGDGTRENRLVPTAVAGGRRFRSLYAGGALTCGIATDGAQYCWGLNQNGQLGDGTRESRSLPTRVGG